MGDKSQLCVVCGRWAEPFVRTPVGPMHPTCDDLTRSEDATDGEDDDGASVEWITS